MDLVRLVPNKFINNNNQLVRKDRSKKLLSIRSQKLFTAVSVSLKPEKLDIDYYNVELLFIWIPIKHQINPKPKFSKMNMMINRISWINLVKMNKMISRKMKQSMQTMKWLIL